MLAETSLDRIITQVCQHEWQKELTEKFRNKFTINWVVTAS